MTTTEFGADAIAYLNMALEIRKQVGIKQKRIEMLRQLAQSVTTRMSLAPGSGGGSTSDKVANGVAAIMDVVEEIDYDLVQMAHVQRLIGRAIQDYVHDEKHRSLLEARYLACLPWDDVAKALGVTRRWAMTLHERAIEELKTNCLAAGEREI